MDGLSPIAHLVVWLSVALLAGLAWRARKAGGARGAGGRSWAGLLLPRGGSGAMLRCRESIRLTPQHTLHVVEYDGVRLLIACHPGGASALPSEAAATPAPGEAARKGAAA